VQRRRRLVLVAVIAVAVLLGGGLTAFVASRAPRPTAAERVADRLPAAKPILWTSCADDSLARLHARCGFVTVPLDWKKPGGATIRVAVSRIAHTASSSQGVVVFNPGGPGESGLATSTAEAQLPEHVRAEYDWIGLDPRGVGASRPLLGCDAHYFDGPRPGYTPTTADIAAWTAKSKAYAAACAKNGALLAHMTPEDTVRDIDRVRVALGQAQITFYGFSYGTYLGQLYATLFPDRLRRMVLDSTVDPRSADDQYGFDQAVAFETVLGKYFAWVARWHTIYDLGTTARAVRARFGAVEAGLARRPVGEVGASEWHDMFLGAGYEESYWPYLTDFFQHQANDPAGNSETDLGAAYRFYGASTDDEYASFMATACTEGRISRDVPAFLAATAAAEPKAPYEAWATAWYDAPCLFWPVAAPSRAPEVDGSRASSVLMIDQTGDAATPYAGSLAVRRLFPAARLLAEPGGFSHADTLSDPDACVTARIAAYLDTGALPSRISGNRADATCPPPAMPTPSDEQ
jgi:pimeloyl-ACP methyl ester carboxylesterase